MQYSMKKFSKALVRHPVVIVFFCFLAVYTVADCCVRNKARDEYENRQLAQFPSFSWQSLLKNEWTVKYEEYVQDQFLFRHSWIEAKSVAESLLQRTENNAVVYGEDGYQFYKFMALPKTLNGADTQLNQNTGYLQRFIQRHPNRVTVLIAPSAANILSDKLPAGAPLLEENPYLDSLFETLTAAGAKTCDVRSAFRQSAADYLYYRTDHHWTTDGAFLAYRQLGTVLDVGEFHPENYSRMEVTGFTGTNYNKSLKYNTVADTLIYYEMDAPLTVKNLLQDGTELDNQLGGIYDLSKLDTRDKYGMFLRGNNGYSTVEGKGDPDRRVLVIKDSYANCFVPFLTADYGQIDVVDLRYWKQNVDGLIELFDYEDVLVLYNFQTFSTETTLFYLNAMVK